ncbi:MAG: ATP-binding cassette domain-containing protein [Clostridia bacterium]|nr:ATP-binding cassette domain-containing protein [Clostridia bacterium]
MIELSHIQKTFRVARRSAGMREAARALFRREYTEVRALDDISFTIGDGEMVGYIGPNGAGKSSSIKVMSGILTPDAGSCVIDGCVPWRDRRKHVANIGVVFGQRSQLWWDVPVIDSFELIRDIYRVEETVYRQSLDELTELLDLGEILRTPTRQLSLGQRMRCEIAASLIHRPRILFLDEPTIGLDAVSKLAVREFIRRINRERGTTVILTTHDMQDIEALTERILLIGRGRILLDGSLEALKTRHSALRQITVVYAPGTLSPAARPLPCGITLSGQSEGRAVFAVDTDTLSVSSAIEALTREIDVRDLSVTGQSTDELVVSLYEEFRI